MAGYKDRKYARDEPLPRKNVAKGKDRKVRTKLCTKCEKETPETLLEEGVCVYCRTASIAEQSKIIAEEEEQSTESRLEAERKQRQQMYREKQEAEAERAKAAKEEAARDREAFDQQEEARKELARRQLAHDHLLPLVMRVDPDYKPGWIHKDICEHLEWFSNAVAAGESPRLMLFVPPRHGKSELASRVFPAWHLGRNPKHEIISCSYAGSLANDFSRKVRGLLREKSYQTVFPEVALSQDSQSVEVWSTNHEGGYVAAGVGGPITGRGSDVMIIDDPLKNRADAESETTREGIWDWYTSTAYTRLSPGGGVILIQTRWHDADLGGRLLEQMSEGEGDDWRVVNYPAIAEHDELFRKQGEALHPERFPISALERIKRTIGPRDWSALYQQNPVADDGDYFKTEDFQWFLQQEMPLLEEMNFYTGWDLAIGQTEQNDFTVGITVGVDRKDNIYVVDVQRGRWRTIEIVEKMLEVQKVWQSRIVGIERGHISMTMGPILEKRIQETRTMMPIEELRPGRQDKVARARPIQARMQQRRVFFRKHCDVTMSLVAEMKRFPNGQHDDQCLVAGTMVSTPRGATPIEALNVGDEVVTPAGPRKVTGSGITGSKSVFRLELPDGRTVEGSANHPIFTLNRGFVRMDSITWSDQLLVEGLPCQGSKPKRSTASGSGDIQNLFTVRTESIFKRIRRTKRVLSTYIATFGRKHTAQFLTGTTSTTKTATRSTTSRITSNACRLGLTPTNITTKQSVAAPATSSSRTLTLCVTWRLSGTAARKVAVGTRNTGKRLGKTASGIQNSAEAAANSLRHRSLVEPSSARRPAGTGNGNDVTSGQVATSDLGHLTPVRASTAGQNSNRSNVPSAVSAQLDAGTLKLVSGAKVTRTDFTERVYNIAVEHDHVYFANGVLTHNCDAMAWIGQLLLQFTVTRERKRPPKRSWRDKLSKTIRSADKPNAMTS